VLTSKRRGGDIVMWLEALGAWAQALSHFDSRLENPIDAVVL
jgi:hypothetical protein